MSTKLSADGLTVELASLAKGRDPRTLFDSDAPVEMEVGIGKGGFLLEQAKLRPGVNFLGVEWANKYFRFAADRFARWGLENVRVIRTDAAALIAAWLPDACLDAIHVYFPDPWPKKRHHKRRFFNPGTMGHVVRVLAPGGRLFVATDHVEYFEVIEQVVRARGKLEEIAFPEDFGEAGEIVGSNFERKYVREGRTFYRLAMRKRAHADN
jgi:tRNA (guanine-N7-)-methyltransferase